MRISIVIPALNEEKYIGACIEAIQKNAEGKFDEILVVDNGSTDATAKVASVYPYVRVIHEERRGTSNARQTGFEQAKGEVICFVDADTRMQAGWMDSIMNVLADRPDVVSVSGPYHYFDAPMSWRIVLGLLWWLSAPITYRTVGYMILIGNVAVRRDALVQVGGFDRTVQFYGDDADLARRLNTVGKVVFRMDLYIYSSARRFRSEGIIGTNVRYALNFIWPVIFGRPYTATHQDIR